MSPDPAVLSEGFRSALEERASSGALELPVLPDAAARVVACCSSETTNARELAVLVERDQSLAAHVLEIANSAAFAPAEPIVSLRQAIARLGSATLCDIAVSIALRGKVFDVPHYAPLMRRLWKHSATAGAFAREIARATRRNVEGAFLCGLLHDVGKPVTLQALLDVCDEAGVAPDDELVLAALDQYHAPLGALLVRRWKLAPWVAAATEHHHDYLRATEYRDEAMITHLADHLAHWALGTKDLAEEELARLPVVSELDLYLEDVERLIRAKDSVLALAEAFE